MNNDGKKTWNYQVAGIIGLSFFVVLAWGTTLLYLAIFKAPAWENYPIEKLGQVGDFFNIITSLASVITVAFVAYAVILQRKELSAVKEQIEYQTNKLEEDEQVNRTLEILDKWDKTQKALNEPYSDKISLIQRISTLASSQKSYERKIDFAVIANVLASEGIPQELQNLLIREQIHLENLNKQLVTQNTTLKSLTQDNTPKKGKNFSNIEDTYPSQHFIGEQIYPKEKLEELHATIGSLQDKIAFKKCSNTRLASIVTFSYSVRHSTWKTRYK